MAIDHDRLVKIIKTSWKKKKPIFIWGGTGIGKSDSMRRASRELAREENLSYSENEVGNGGHFRLMDVRLSNYDASDVKGLPDLSGEFTVWKLPDWYPRSGKGVLFFDELNLAPPSIQAAAYQIIHDRKLGSHDLPDGWVAMAAGNRMGDRANTFELPAPLRDRFSHFELNPPFPDDWVEWAFDEDLDERIITYIKTRGAHLYTFEENMDKRVFATPRSWEVLSDHIEDLDTGDDFSMIKTYAESRVGDVASEFTGWLNLRDKINIDEIIRNPYSYDYSGLSQDEVFALISAVSEKFQRNERMLKAVIGVCNSIDHEHGVLLLRLIDKKSYSNFDYIFKNTDVKGMDEFITGYAELMSEV